MVVDIAGMAAVLGGLLNPDSIGSVVCTAAENLPCRPLTLECLVAGAGGLGVAWPAISNDPPLPPDRPYDESSNRPDQNQRDYAPQPPPGHQPPAQRDPRDALNDEGFKRAKEDWARDNSDRFPTIPDPDRGNGESAYDTLIKSIQNKGQR